MSSASACEDTFFQAKRSHCLNSSSVFGAWSLYVVSSKIIQIVSRGFTSCEFAGRWSFAIKFPSLPFSLQGFSTFVGHIFIPLCSKLWNCDVEFFLPFCLVELLRNAIYLQFFSITFLTHLNLKKKKKTNIHSLVCLLKSLLLTTCSLISFRLVQQFSNFCDWMARRP